jgi:ubiquinone/menaquinone biosynthesis C-methylase UbiE
MKCEWVDCDRNSVKQRYDRIAKFIPVFDRLFFLPRDLRRKAVDRLELSRGDNVLEIGCGTGNSFSYLYDAVGPAGHIRRGYFSRYAA